MAAAFVLAGCAVVLRAVFSRQLERWSIGAPLAMVAFGVVSGLLSQNSLAAALNTDVAQHIAEVLLAVLLFNDATQVRGARLWGAHPGLVARVLLIAMPASVLLAVLLGLVLLPGIGWPVLLVLACAVVPIDFAAAERLLTHSDLSAKVRSTLNFEGGYNDGIISPVFLFALALAGGVGHTGADATTELQSALPLALKAIACGLVIGPVLAWALDHATHKNWTTPESRRIVVLAAPLLTYAAAVVIGGNGFVASFICGIAFANTARAAAFVERRTRYRGPVPDPIAAEADYRLLHDAISVSVMLMWFTVGSAAVLAFGGGVSWQALVYSAAVLTLIRAIPVLVATTGSSLQRHERLQVAVLGPRGTTSIVFALLAFNGLRGSDADAVLVVTTICLLGSVVLHGPTADPFIRRTEPAWPRQSPKQQI